MFLIATKCEIVSKTHVTDLMSGVKDPFYFLFILKTDHRWHSMMDFDLDLYPHVGLPLFFHVFRLLLRTDMSTARLHAWVLSCYLRKKRLATGVPLWELCNFVNSSPCFLKTALKIAKFPAPLINPYECKDVRGNILQIMCQFPRNLCHGSVFTKVGIKFQNYAPLLCRVYICRTLTMPCG